MSKELKIRDFTDKSDAVKIEVVASPIFDMLVSIWAVSSDEDLEGYEVGSEWFRGLQKGVGRALRKELDDLTGPAGLLWIGLFGLIGTAPKPHDVDSVLQWLSQVDPQQIRSSLLGCCTDLDRTVAKEAATAQGEDAARILERIENPAKRDHLRKLLAIEPEVLRDRIVSALAKFRQEVFGPYEADFGPKLARDARATKVLAKDMAPVELIETVTNGLVYRPEPGVRRLVLVPSVVMRPWCLIAEYDGNLILSYPAADENLTADSQEAPPWLVKVLKALADEKRLRILHRLGQGEASLDDLTELLGVAKSTVHHHVGQLRGAGLVRVVTGGSTDSRYALRPAVYPEISEILEEYVGIPHTTLQLLTS